MVKPLILLLALTPLATLAQEAAGPYGPPARNNVAVGLGVGVAPRYSGSDKYEFSAGPAFTVSNGTFFLDQRGLGAQYRAETGTSAGLAVSYDPGRKEKHNHDLKGMGKIKGSALLNASLEQELGANLSVSGEGNFRIAGQKKRGNDYKLGLNGHVPLGVADTLTAGAAVHLGDRNYNQTYYGVNATQSQNSGKKEFHPKAGVYGYSANGGWQHQFDKNWSSMVVVERMNLSGKVKGSPIIKKKGSWTGMAGVQYQF